jgi:hydrogenase large subunit
LLEIALVVQLMESWVREIEPKEPFCHHAPIPEEAHGAGLVEAARGSLGHWVKVKHGRILNYQIVAPTTWNFSPRDLSGQPGPLEQALKGARLREGEQDPVSVQHIVRSFDPCMVCTVH